MEERFTKYRGYSIVVDKADHDDLTSPRDWAGYLEQFVLEYPDVDLPNEIGLSFTDFTWWDELEQYLSKDYKIIVPVWLYNHDGVWLNAYEPKPEWDKLFIHRVGYVVISKHNIKDYYNTNKLNKKAMQDVKTEILCAIEDYNRWVNNDYYYYSIRDEDATGDGDYEYEFEVGWDDYEESLKEGKEAVDRIIKDGEDMRIPIKDFVNNCCDYGFTDYDGYGYLIKELNAIPTKEIIYPSNVCGMDEATTNKLLEDWWGVEWYNR